MIKSEYKNTTNIIPVSTDKISKIMRHANGRNIHAK